MGSGNTISAPERQAMPQIAIAPVAEGFAVTIDGRAVQLCTDELDAHHWGKHAFEAINQGLRSVTLIDLTMRRLCMRATRYNLHQ